MDDLIAFLQARLDEDESAAQGAANWSEGCTQWADAGEPDWVHIARHDPARVLADIESKRRMVDLLSEESADIGAGNPWWYDRRILTPMLRLLALPYSGHPDYRAEWAPTVV